MNIKSVFSTINDVIVGFVGVLTGLVTLGVMAQVIFGTGTLGLDIVGNISALVTTFMGGGLAGLIALIVLFGLWTDK
jgi:hypothetical protein|tara:strand:- start:2721 stop:2951 length:231 start_codon:yes stop_codon:yes gene_type:complete